jgi:hypothetical protein
MILSALEFSRRGSNGINPNAMVQFLDTGHFALETNVQDVAWAMRQFLASNNV